MSFCGNLWRDFRVLPMPDPTGSVRPGSQRRCTPLRGPGKLLYMAVRDFGDLRAQNQPKVCPNFGDLRVQSRKVCTRLVHCWGFETDLGCFGPCPWSQNKSKINVNYGVLPGPTRHHPLNFKQWPSNYLQTSWTRSSRFRAPISSLKIFDCLLKDKHKVLLSTKGSERCVCTRERRRFDLGEEAEMRVEHSRTARDDDGTTWLSCSRTTQGRPQAGGAFSAQQ